VMPFLSLLLFVLGYRIYRNLQAGFGNAL